MAVERHARGMGTDITVIVVGADKHATDALARLSEPESRWSRFSPDSDVSRLNAVAGEPVAVSDDTITLMKRAGDAWRISGGSCAGPGG